jgi:hypothetical protein
MTAGRGVRRGGRRGGVSRVMAVVGAIAMVGVVCTVCFRYLGPDGSARRPITSAVVPMPVVPLADVESEAAAHPVVVGPAERVWGVPSGYGPSPAGAQAAAVGWVASLGQLMQLGPVALGDTLNELMTVRAAAATESVFRVERDRFTAEFDADPVRAIWVESPLQFDLVDYTSERATVAVWSQLLLGVDTEPEVRVLWRTHTVTLLWERGGWRVDDVTRVEGPTPLVIDSVLPSPGSEFTRLADWSPAVTAGIATNGEVEQ